MDDPQLRSFFKRSLSSGKSGSVGHVVRFSCANPASCGSSAGVRLLQQQRPGIESSHVTLESPPGADGGRPLLHTENVERLSLSTAVLSGSAEQRIALEIDGDVFAEPFAGSVVFCRGEGGTASAQNDSAAASGTGWQQCDQARTCAADASESESETAEPRCCRQPLRSADVSAGPIRRVLAAPFVCVYGTAHPSPKVSEHYRAAAVEFANAWSAVGGGVTSVLPDTEVNLEAGGLDGRNVVLWGGADTNGLARALAPEQPVVQLELDKGAAQTTAKKKKKRIGGGFAVGGCTYTEEGTGMVSLGPVARANGTDGRLVVALAGTTLGGFDKAVELFTSRLFDTNSWQHRLPEFAVAGPSFVAAKAGRMGGREDNLRGVVAAGWFDSRWNVSTEASYVAC